MRVKPRKRTLWRGGLAAALVAAAHVVPATGAAAAPDLFSVELRPLVTWRYESGNGGYCAEIIVTNLTGNTLVWEVDVTLPGRITTYWNFEAMPIGGERYRIHGMPWNRFLEYGASTTDVGYCAYMG